MPKTTRLNATYYFIIKIPNKRELQQIASNHSFEIDFKDFLKLYKDYTKELDLLEKEKGLLEKAAAIKRFEYLLLGKELKAQADIVRKQYQNLDDTFESNKKKEFKT